MNLFSLETNLVSVGIRKILSDTLALSFFAFTLGITQVDVVQHCILLLIITAFKWI